jgi:sugar/nucleoside kinase (ribokinase family)
MKGASTQIAFIIIDERNGERTVIWDRDKKLSFLPEEAPIGGVERSRVLHFTPHDVEACTILAKEARRSGVIVSADIDNMFDGAETLFSLVDVFIASADLPRRLFGPIEKSEALHRMQERFGCKIVGITLGEEGSMLLCEDTIIETPGFSVPGGCRDTTGAGDSFRVGLLYGMLKGESLEVAARMANAVAALKCRSVGARTALPTESELTELIRNI